MITFKSKRFLVINVLFNFTISIQVFTTYEKTTAKSFKVV